MSTLKRLTKLKQQAAALQTARDKAEGARGEIMKRLKRKYGCKTLAEARKLLRKTQRQETTARETFELALEDFETQWGDSLQEDE